MTAPCTPRPDEHAVRPTAADDDRAVCSTAGWWQAACCRGADTETFFPLPGDQATVQRALAICESCPVRIPCRRYALGSRERHGIWGGLTEETRELLIRMGPPLTLDVPERNGASMAAAAPRGVARSADAAARRTGPTDEG
ncbi:WhiB family transcriptional regulator [Streptomyces sp. NPDC002588]|uniref:WhiB family transcriptional regulator n=1 Tax=Streptomyces sp. NPDC002588 TaxID=3154419 RepID=UPI0033262370